MKKIARLDEEMQGLALQIWETKELSQTQIKLYQNELNDMLDFVEHDEHAWYAARYKECLKNYLRARITFKQLKTNPRENAEMIILAEKQIRHASIELHHIVNDVQLI